MLQFNFNFIHTLRRVLLHVLLPDTCRSCRRDLAYSSSAPLCSACEKAVQIPGPLYCRRCGRPLPDGGAYCWQCRGSKAKKLKCKIIRSAVVFGLQMRGLIHSFKYAEQPYLAAYLAELMNTSWPMYEELASAQLLIPVPLHPKKRRKRSYNQSELLACALARLRGLPVDTDSLIRVRNTPSQTQFGREGRLKNMSGAFSCIHPEAVKGKIILLIDDVATTGATLEGCAEALKAAGAKKVMAYTLAREV